LYLRRAELKVLASLDSTSSALARGLGAGRGRPRESKFVRLAGGLGDLGKIQAPHKASMHSSASSHIEGACISQRLGKNSRRQHSPFCPFCPFWSGSRSAHDWPTRSWQPRWRSRKSLGTKRMRSDGQARGLLAVAVAELTQLSNRHESRKGNPLLGGLFGVDVLSHHSIRVRLRFILVVQYILRTRIGDRELQVSPSDSYPPG
jgi:hypothetical protein